MWKGLTALAGVYFMFLIEHFLTLAKMYKDKKQKVSGGGRRGCHGDGPPGVSGPVQIQRKWDQDKLQPALENSLKPSDGESLTPDP